MNSTISDREWCRMLMIATRLGLYLSNSSHLLCPVNFDGRLCWPSTEQDAYAYLECPGLKDSPKRASRLCMSGGRWAKSADYLPCSTVSVPIEGDIPHVHYLIMYYIYWVGFSVSLLLLVVALFVFIGYKSLDCTRIKIHTNLTLCFALHNAFWIVYSLFSHEIGKIAPGNLFLCSIPATLLKYLTVAGFFWMFVEGFYLMISVVFSFHARKVSIWMCALAGWVLPFVLVGLSALLKVYSGDNHCFDETQHLLDYIYVGPILVVLFVNFIFLFIVMYVIMAKLQLLERNEVDKYKKGLRALLILSPLLGTSYVLALFHPREPLWLRLTFAYYTTLVTATQVRSQYNQSKTLSTTSRRLNASVKGRPYGPGPMVRFSTRTSSVRLDRTPPIQPRVITFDESGKLKLMKRPTYKKMSTFSLPRSVTLTEERL